MTAPLTVGRFIEACAILLGVGALVAAFLWMLVHAVDETRADRERDAVRRARAQLHVDHERDYIRPNVRDT